MGASLTAADLRATDFLLGLLVSFGVTIGTAWVVLHVHREAPRPPQVEEAEVIAVRPVALEAAPARSREEPPREEPPEVPRIEPAATPVTTQPPIERRRSRPRAHARPVAAAPATDTDGPEVIDGTGTHDDGEALVAQYRSTLRHWLAARVRVRDTGLDASELQGKRVRLVLEIDPGRTIVRATIVPTGTAAFDRAALAALDAIRGQTLPAPPEGYPGPLQRRIPVVFICNPGACR